MTRTVKLSEDKHTELLNIQVGLKRLTNKKYSLDLILSSIIDLFIGNFNLIDLAKKLDPSYKKKLNLPNNLQDLINLENSMHNEINKRLNEVKSKLIFFKNLLIKFDQINLKNRILDILRNLEFIISDYQSKIGIEVGYIKSGTKNIKNKNKNKIQILKQLYIINYFVLEDISLTLDCLNIMNEYILNQNFIFFNEDLVKISNFINQIRNACILREKLRNNILCFDEIENVVDITIGDFIRGKNFSKEMIMEKIERIILKIIEEKRREKNYNPVLLNSLYYEIKNREPSLKFTIDDLDKIIRNLIEKGLIEDFQSFNNIKLIRLVPFNLSLDQIEVIKLISNFNNINLTQVIKELNWDKDRAKKVLDSLVNAGILRYTNSYAEGSRWHLII
ncbi:MAG: hypothetical protein ACTSRP_15575 [Candidatus Helarchaeota archaeon]